jgi:hypothetical protein
LPFFGCPSRCRVRNASPAGRFEAIEDFSIDIGLLLAAYGVRRLRWRGDIGAGGKDDFP